MPLCAIREQYAFHFVSPSTAHGIIKQFSICVSSHPLEFYVDEIKSNIPSEIENVNLAGKCCTTIHVLIIISHQRTALAEAPHRSSLPPLLHER